jgi:hypothetical protein
MLRAQCRRILLTLLGDRRPELSQRQAQQLADELLSEVFGGAAAKTRISIDDARGPFEEEHCHVQLFTAIDRFSGAVSIDKSDDRSKGKLYRVTAVMPPRLDWRLTLQPALLERPWVLGLLSHLLHDAMEGDLSIGWGRARGFGALHLGLTTPDGQTLDDWGQLQLALEQDRLPLTRQDVEAWTQALEQKLNADSGDSGQQALSSDPMETS